VPTADEEFCDRAILELLRDWYASQRSRRPDTGPGESEIGFLRCMGSVRANHSGWAGCSPSPGKISGFSVLATRGRAIFAGAARAPASGDWSAMPPAPESRPYHRTRLTLLRHTCWLAGLCILQESWATPTHPHPRRPANLHPRGRGPVEKPREGFLPRP
jgi:hypothetical protein